MAIFPSLSPHINCHRQHLFTTHVFAQSQLSGLASFLQLPHPFQYLHYHDEKAASDRATLIHAPQFPRSFHHYISLQEISSSIHHDYSGASILYDIVNTAGWQSGLGRGEETSGGSMRMIKGEPWGMRKRLRPTLRRSHRSCHHSRSKHQASRHHNTSLIFAWHLRRSLEFYCIKRRSSVLLICWQCVCLAKEEGEENECVSPYLSVIVAPQLSAIYRLLQTAFSVTRSLSLTRQCSERKHDHPFLQYVNFIWKLFTAACCVCRQGPCLAGLAWRHVAGSLRCCSVASMSVLAGGVPEGSPAHSTSPSNFSTGSHTDLSLSTTPNVSQSPRQHQTLVAMETPHASKN